MSVGHEILTYTSIVIGWIYFAAWSLSFYPQVIENWWNKSVIGLSFDFLLLNMTGHSCYMVYNAVLYWDPYVRSLYEEKYHTKDSPVRLNDVIFSIHAVLLTGITIFQCFIYERGNQVVSWTARILFAIMMLIIGVFLFLTFADVTSWLLMMNCLGYIKLSISFFKYVPQAWLNYKRKMTIGWSIGQILLDLTGGLLSFAQMFLDAINTNDWSSFKGGNIPKLGLSCLTIIFDLIFIIQHYILYRNNNKIHYENQKAEKSGLLPTLVNEIDDHQQIPADINDEKKNDEEQPILQNDNLRSKLQKSAMLDSEP